MSLYEYEYPRMLEPHLAQAKTRQPLCVGSTETRQRWSELAEPQKGHRNGPKLNEELKEESLIEERFMGVGGRDA